MSERERVYTLKIKVSDQGSVLDYQLTYTSNLGAVCDVSFLPTTVRRAIVEAVYRTAKALVE